MQSEKGYWQEVSMNSTFLYQEKRYHHLFIPGIVRCPDTWELGGAKVKLTIIQFHSDYGGGELLFETHFLNVCEC